MVAGNTFAIGVAQTDLEDWIGAARPLKRYWANSAGRGIEGGDDRDWFGYSLDHISTIYRMLDEVKYCLSIKYIVL